jgi:hypothetical protein
MAVKGLKVGSLNTSDDVPGLVLLNTQTVSAVGSVSFPTSTFTATYNTYLFTFDLTGSTALTLRARVRASGTDETGAIYNRTNWEGAIAGYTSTGTTYMDIAQLYDSNQLRSAMDFIITDVQVSGRYKSGISRSNTSLSTGAPYPVERFLTVNSTSSYDSITFLTDTGTVTGSISCYAYNQ